MRFQMTVEDRLVADGYGWLVGFDYEAQRSAPLPEPLRDALEERGYVNSIGRTTVSLFSPSSFVR